MFIVYTLKSHKNVFLGNVNGSVPFEFCKFIIQWFSVSLLGNAIFHVNVTLMDKNWTSSYSSGTSDKKIKLAKELKKDVSFIQTLDISVFPVHRRRFKYKSNILVIFLLLVTCCVLQRYRFLVWNIFVFPVHHCFFFSI